VHKKGFRLPGDRVRVPHMGDGVLLEPMASDVDAWFAELDRLEAVAIKWGEIQANARLHGRPRPQNDTWIAACCLTNDLPLATLNTKDLTGYAEHDGLRFIGAGSQ
jgi:virulence-associated protein VagC